MVGDAPSGRRGTRAVVSGAVLAVAVCAADIGEPRCVVQGTAQGGMVVGV